MSEFKLNLEIDEDSLRLIRSVKERIILAKPVGNGAPNVIWQSFSPFESNNVSWEENYGLYASTTQVTNGATIRRSSDSPSPAVDAAVYPFDLSATFRTPEADPQIPAGTFATENQFQELPKLTFGLFQSAVVNGETAERPVNAVEVARGRLAQFTPFTTVFIWLQADLQSKTVVTRIASTRTEVRFGGGVDEITLNYNPETGAFSPTSSRTAGASLVRVVNLQTL